MVATGHYEALCAWLHAWQSMMFSWQICSQVQATPYGCLLYLTCSMSPEQMHSKERMTACLQVDCHLVHSETPFTAASTDSLRYSICCTIGLLLQALAPVQVMYVQHFALCVCVAICACGRIARAFLCHKSKRRLTLHEAVCDPVSVQQALQILQADARLACNVVKIFALHQIWSCCL